MIPLLPAALAIINKHASHPKCVAKNLALPVLTNQKRMITSKMMGELMGKYK